MFPLGAEVPQFLQGSSVSAALGPCWEWPACVGLGRRTGKEKRGAEPHSCSPGRACCLPLWPGEGGLRGLQAPTCSGMGVWVGPENTWSLRMGDPTAQE